MFQIETWGPRRVRPEPHVRSTGLLRGSGGGDEAGAVGDENRDDGTEDRADNRNPGVAPVGTTLALDRENCVSNTRAEVTSRVDRVSGGATERVTNDDDDQCNAERANRGGRVSGDEDPEDEDESADGLSESVPSVGADLRAGREDAELESRVAVLIEVLFEGEPAQDGANECTEELGDDVDRDVRRCRGPVRRRNPSCGRQP